MNPYDFARIDWNRPPERRKPIWHHQLVGQGPQRLYSGYIDVDIFAETPIFVSDPRNVPPDPKKPAQFMQNKARRLHHSGQLAQRYAAYSSRNAW